MVFGDNDTISRRSSSDINIQHSILEPKRQGDQSIMQAAANNYFSNTELSAINRVRSFHEIVNISDICEADGKTLHPLFMEKVKYNFQSNDYKWPIKHNVLKSDYTIWNKLLKRVFCGGNDQLEVPLGNWTHDQIWKDNWQWFISTDKKYLYQKMNDGKWYRYLQKPHLHRLYFSRTSVLSDMPNVNILRSSVAKQKGGWFLKNYSRKYETNVKDQERMLTIGKLIFKYPQVNWFLSHLSSSCNTEILLECIKNGVALAVSDGSFFPLEEVGSCAWIFSTPDGKEWIWGGGVVPGESHDLITGPR